MSPSWYACRTLLKEPQETNIPPTHTHTMNRMNKNMKLSHSSQTFAELQLRAESRATPQTEPAEWTQRPQLPQLRSSHRQTFFSGRGPSPSFPSPSHQPSGHSTNMPQPAQGEALGTSCQREAARTPNSCSAHCPFRSHNSQEGLADLTNTSNFLGSWIFNTHFQAPELTLL